jgi:DNA-binding MarR family transcriptional regulator
MYINNRTGVKTYFYTVNEVKMNKTVELVNAWGQYEATHPNATIDDFCHSYIMGKRAIEKNKKAFAGNVPPDTYSKIAKLVGRIAKLHSAYAILILKECGLNSLDEFLYLSSIAKMESPKKTKVIYENFNELSSGLLILERLKDKCVVVEEGDEGDKRSKRLKLSKKGITLLNQCYKQMGMLNEWFFKSISKEDIDLCIHLLSTVEADFSSRWLEDKGKSSKMLIGN